MLKLANWMQMPLKKMALIHFSLVQKKLVELMNTHMTARVSCLQEMVSLMCTFMKGNLTPTKGHI